ncbi:unnamed protein product [Linum trigynum]|uniref:Uncharacterized protein n=1 Tax=Linum trigynum TaxID=586398 RepID=A0AAV2CMH6_9ROSI
MLPYSHQSRLKSTCKSWCISLSSGTLISLRRLRRHLSDLLCIFPKDPSISSPYLFDLGTLAYKPLPPVPCNPYVYGLCNFTTVSLGTHLYVPGGSIFETRSFPMDRPSTSFVTVLFSLAASIGTTSGKR